MNGVEGWIIGTAFLWIVIYIFVNPVARYIATHRLRKTRVRTYDRKIDPESIPDRYFMFSGALIGYRPFVSEHPWEPAVPAKEPIFVLAVIAFYNGIFGAIVGAIGGDIGGKIGK